MIGEILNSQIVAGGFEKLSSQRAEPLTSSASPDHSKTRLKKAVKEFEALFIYNLLKEMRQTTNGGFLGKGLGNDIYSSLFDMEVARLMSERGLGLGKMLLKQLEKSVPKEALQANPVSKNQKPGFKIGENTLIPPPLQKEGLDSSLPERD